MWDLVKSFTNGVEIAEGYEFSLMEDHDLLGDALDFIEDVAAHQDRSAEFTKLTNDVHDGCPSERVATLQGLVKDDEFGVVDQGMSDFCALAHSL